MASLLRKEPSARPQSAAEIMIHPFFAGMDWDALLAREVPPPWAPPVAESNFDNEFTGLPLNFDEHAEGPGLSRVRSRASCYLERCSFLPDELSFYLPGGSSGLEVDLRCVMYVYNKLSLFSNPKSHLQHSREAK